MESEVTLVILAAGMGSRFGGLKQIEPLGPNNEFLIDYSIYDAKQAGFNKVVFIISRENEEIFKETIINRIKDQIKVEYVFQEKTNLPVDFMHINNREKPWGTAHAIMCAKEKIKGPFLIINADDYYDKEAYKVGYDHIVSTNEYCIVGYHINKVLSENGAVKRGVCIEKNNELEKIYESKCYRLKEEIVAEPLNGDLGFAVRDNYCAMNMMGFDISIFEELENRFLKFLQNNEKNINNCEYLLPDLVNEIINEKVKKIKVVKTNSVWMGLTYKEDVIAIRKRIKELTENGIYPYNLWKNN